MDNLLYEQDFYSWVWQQWNLLRQGQFDQLEVSHSIEELDDLGNRHDDHLESHLMQLTAHLLKWQVQRCNRTNKKSYYNILYLN